MADTHAHAREVVGAHLKPVPAEPHHDDETVDLDAGQTVDTFQPEASSGTGEASPFGLTHIFAILIAIALLGVMVFLALQGQHALST